MWYSISPKGVSLTVHVQPGAKTTDIVGPYNDALKIRLNAPPVDGKANTTLIDFVASCFKAPKRNVSLESGQTSRRKRLLITGATALPTAWAQWIDA